MENFLVICTGILAFTVSAYGVFVIIKSCSIDKMHRKIKILNIDIETVKNILNKFCYIVANMHSGKFDEKIIEILETADSINTKNNLGIIYLEMSRHQTNGICNNNLLNDAKQYFEIARKLYENKNRNHKYDKNLSIVYVNLADVNDDLNNKELALKQCENAIKYDSYNSLAYNMRASILMELNRLDEAEQAVNQALFLDAQNSYALLTKAEIMLKKNCENENEVWESYFKALENGCPAWLYLKNIENSSYQTLVEKLKQTALKFEENYKIAQMQLQTEYKYIL